MNAPATNVPAYDELVQTVDTLRDGLAGLALLCEQADDAIAPHHAAALMTMMAEYAEAKVPQVAPG